MPRPTPEQCFASVLATAEKIKHYHQPRRRPRHAERNIAIFKKCEIENMTHAEAADHFHLDRTGITQIVNQYRRKFAQAAPDDPDIKDHPARLRLERQLQRLRLDFALEKVTSAIHDDRSELHTERAGSKTKNGDEERWSESVKRQTAKSARLINTFVRITNDLAELRDREEAETQGVNTTMTPEQLLYAIAIIFEYRWYDPDNRPSQEFMDMVEAFRKNIFTWVIRRREGFSPAQSWPDPYSSHGAGKGTSAHENPAKTNIPGGQVRTGLISPPAFPDAATPSSQTA